VEPRHDDPIQDVDRKRRTFSGTDVYTQQTAALYTFMLTII